jgi:hypothetical protein
VATDVVSVERIPWLLCQHLSCVEESKIRQRHVSLLTVFFESAFSYNIKRFIHQYDNMTVHSCLSILKILHFGRNMTSVLLPNRILFLISDICSTRTWGRGKDLNYFIILIMTHDRLCGLVVRVPGYRSGAPGFDSWHYKQKVVGLERGPLSLVSTTEELLGRNSSAPV